MLFKAIEENEQESRRNWLKMLLKKDGKIWFRESGYHREEVRTRSFFDTKLNYIHPNPVRAGWV